MPEIGEVARIVHFLRAHLVGRTITGVRAAPDENVYGKVGCDAASFEQALRGKTVLDVGQRGKYFWLILSTPPHPLLHLGMTGWVHIRGIPTSYRPERGVPDDPWPPKFWKFALEATAKDGGGAGTNIPKVVEPAFCDARRFARIRLIDCPGERIRDFSPLKENGPDPVVERERVTPEWFAKVVGTRRAPVKAVLLDQGVMSGIGNWVADEILHNCSMHPAQPANSLDAKRMRELYDSTIYVTSTAVDKLSDFREFPPDWIFSERWGKGKKKTDVNPEGKQITYVTVAGRTSAIVAEKQKLKNFDGEDGDEGEQNGSPKAATNGARRTAKRQLADQSEDGDANVSKRKRKGKTATSQSQKHETDNKKTQEHKTTKNKDQDQKKANKKTTSKTGTKSEHFDTESARNGKVRGKSVRAAKSTVVVKSNPKSKAKAHPSEKSNGAATNGRRRSARHGSND